MSNIKTTIKTAFKTSGVRPLFNMMGIKKAGKVIEIIQNQVVLHGETGKLEDFLTTHGYFLGKKYLKNTLPDMAIGHKFDDNECALLSSLTSKQKIKLFAGFDADRAKNMWQAYYNKHDLHAVVLLNDLAENNIGLALKALGGKEPLKDSDKPLLLDIFKSCDKLNYADLELPINLVKLNDPIIWNAVKELDFKMLSKLFVEYYMYTERELDYHEKEKVIHSVVSSLGIGKAYQFYKALHLEFTPAGIRLRNQYPDLGELIKDNDDKVISAIKQAVYLNIADAIANAVNTEYFQQIFHKDV